METLTGKHRKTVPMSIIPAVKIMDTLNPLTSNMKSTGITGIMYMIFPQFPKSAKVAGVHSGHKTAKSDAEIGPKEFQIMP